MGWVVRQNHSPFTTNASESINAMLKRKVNYKRSELPTFVDKVKELIKEQQEVERAVIGRGKYKLKYQYQSQRASGL